VNEIDIRVLFLQKIKEILVTDKAKLSVSRKTLNNRYSQDHYEPDMLAELKFGDKSASVVIEFKANGRPGTVNQVVGRLKRYAEVLDALPIFVAPHIGPQACQVLRQEPHLFCGSIWKQVD